MNRIRNRMERSHNKYPRGPSSGPGSIVFNPMLLIERDRPEFFPSELTGYCYKNYDISFSVRTYNNYPHRVLSITPHGFNPKSMTDLELIELLEHFIFYSFLSIGNYSSAHTDDPYTGDTQYYYQIIMDMQDLQKLPVAAGQ